MPEEKFTPVVYACKRYPGFSFKGTDRWFRFQKHQLTLDNAEDVADMDMHIEKYPNIGSKVQKVDISQAEALVAHHIKTHGGAARGPFTSVQGNQGDINTIAQRDAKMAAMSPQQEEELRETLAKQSELLTTTVVNPKSEREILQPSVKPKISVGGNK